MRAQLQGMRASRNQMQGKGPALNRACNCISITSGVSTDHLRALYPPITYARRILLVVTFICIHKSLTHNLLVKHPRVYPNTNHTWLSSLAKPHGT